MYQAGIQACLSNKLKLILLCLHLQNAEYCDFHYSYVKHKENGNNHWSKDDSCCQGYMVKKKLICFNAKI